MGKHRTIVGVDGSTNSAVALRWAADRVERLGGEVVAVLAWSFFDQGHRAKGEDLLPDFGEGDAARVLAEAVAAAGVTGPVTHHTIEGFPAEEIAQMADPNDLIVVGARGTGGFEGLLLGSVSHRLLELAECPVAVIHDVEADAPGGEVVIGVDGSELSMAALRWAAAEARANDLKVRIVHAWQSSVYADVIGPSVLDAIEDRAAEMMARAAEDPALAGCDVETEVAYGSPAQVLLSHDVDASMIVVASRGHGALKRLFLGSTSRQVAQHANSPVVVVPSAR